jgi:NTE family protein
LKKKQIGLVLSGGGARAFAHLGVLKAIEEYQIDIACVAATSMGAVVGAFWAKGYSTNDIKTVLETIRIRKFLQWNWSKGILNQKKIYHLLSNYFPNNSFESLKKPLYITCTDIQEGKKVVFSEGELLEPLVGSITVPGLMMPFAWKNNQLVDGGMLENLPATVLQGKCDYLIGVHSNPIGKKTVNNLRNSIERAFLIIIAQNVKQTQTLCDLLIEPKELADIRFSDFKKIDLIVEIGYQEAKKQLYPLIEH